LRALKLAAVAIPRLSTGSSAPFLAAPFFCGPITRCHSYRRNIGGCLTEFAL
jgi:hypothetical protein